MRHATRTSYHYTPATGLRDSCSAAAAPPHALAKVAGPIAAIACLYEGGSPWITTAWTTRSSSLDDSADTLSRRFGGQIRQVLFEHGVDRRAGASCK